MKFISILICTYNAEDTIEQTLNSCLNQTYKNFEILIHDDQSKDKTIEIIK
ncbi:glycosyltransferase [bacterium]|nr:glycosyltransferase [bacterium]